MKTSDAVLVGLLFLAGCSPPPQGAGPTASPGRTRVISLTPNLTEILFALEAGPQVVGVTRNDHYPPQVDNLPKVGDMQLNYEAVLSLHPDLVVYDPVLNQQQLPQLEKLGLKLEALSTRNLAEMQDSILKLGRALGREQRAIALVESLKAELARCQVRSRKLKRHPTALLEIWHDPLMAAGKGTYSSEIMERAGFRNVLERSGFPALTMEELYVLNPEVLILTQPVARELATRPAWQQLAAVRQGKVLEVPEDLLVRPGPRVVDALHRLQDWLEKQSD